MAAGRPAKRGHARRVTRHAHVLAVGEPPAVKHRLLHGGYQKTAVGTDGGAEMRPLPFKFFRRGLRCIREPKRGAVVMGDGKAEAFWQEGQSADGRRSFELAQLLGLHESGLAGRPGNGSVWSKCEMIDPAMFCIGGERAHLALYVRRNDFAVIAASDDTLAIAGRRENGSGVDVDTPRLGFRLGQEKRFLAENKHRCASEKMRANDGPAGR